MDIEARLEVAIEEREEWRERAIQVRKMLSKTLVELAEAQARLDTEAQNFARAVDTLVNR